MLFEKRSIRYDYYRLLHRSETVSSLASSLLSTRDAALAASVAVDGPEAVWEYLAALSVEEDELNLSATLSPDRVLQGYAPTALLDGCWLTGSVQVERTHSLLGQICLDAFFLECGMGDETRHHGTLYRLGLSAAGSSVGVPASRAFVQDERFGEADFELALFGLRLGRAGEELLPELLGFHVAMTLWGPPRLVRTAAAVVPKNPYLAVHEHGSATQNQAELLAKRSLRAYAELDTPSWSRVIHGALALREKRQIWQASLTPKQTLSAQQAMLQLLASKLQHGAGFHRRVMLGGRTLDSWFDPRQSDGTEFLKALSQSPFVVPGQPERSPIVNRSTQFGGPMFGVFNDQELAVLRDWISSLSAHDARSADHQEALVIVPAQTSVQKATFDDERPPASTRAAPLPPLPMLYHRFLCEAQKQRTVDLAHHYLCEKIREVSSAGKVERLQTHGLWPWSAERLSAWVSARLHQQVFDGNPPSDQPMGVERYLARTEVIWLLQQLAPAALIDGAWLQGMTSPACYHSAVATLLFRIYRDELGAGIPHQHHGNIMRQVLADQGVTLPACSDVEFVRHPGFLSESFSTPVLWLAFALHSGSFLPELLGLNLAIEMAGVGRMYDRAAVLLRSHQIDPYFFVLHNTIDNGASGHTAWSVHAIQLYLDELALHADASVVAQAWQRVWRGYATYGRSSAPLLRAVALRIGPQLGFRWLRQKLLPRAAREAS